MTNKQYTFSLTPVAGEIIDSLPKKEQSEYVTKALLMLKKKNTRKKALDCMSLLNPSEWDTEKNSVDLVKEARIARAEQITSNADTENE